MSTPSSAAIEAAIQRTRTWFIEQQADFGGWPGTNDAGPDPTAEALIAMRYVDALTPELADKATAYLVSTQLPDGSFPAYPDQPVGTLDETAIVYAALRSAGMPATDPVAERAWAFIREAGGFDACSSLTQLLLAVAGLYPPDWLEDVPMAWVVVPGISRLIGSRFAPAFTFMSHVLGGIVRGLKRSAPPTLLSDPFGVLVDRCIIHHLDTHQNPTGTWFGAQNTTGMACMCLRALGVPPDDPRIQRGIQDMLEQFATEADGALRLGPFDSSIWNTALVTCVMRDSGSAPDDPHIQSAVGYLLEQHTTLSPPADWQNPGLFQPRSGGWPFGRDNPLSQDSDSTSEVVRALAHVKDGDSPQASSVRSALERALTWLLGMRNRDGGWPAFSHGHPTKPPGPFPITSSDITPSSPLTLIRWMIAPPPSLSDPSTVDLTGRVLQGLGANGYTASQPIIQEAAAFLRSQLYTNGVWWGRWECNYLAATSEALSGLAACGVDLSPAWIQNAITWLLEHQNDDGGWGESIQSYENEALAGIGESSPFQTGIVTRALSHAGLAHTDAVSRAIAWLLDQQHEDGSFPLGTVPFVVQWPWPFYRVSLTSEVYAMQALTAYQKATSN